jgi:carbonic anhydrase
MPDFVKKFLANNRKWVEEQLKLDPGYFEKLSEKHDPKVLWIGCSDARVPANQITGTLPGEIFVHRNISNLVIHTDMNMLSVLSYAVEILRVRHIVVCGHYKCGGVTAAMTNQSFGLIDNWLRNVKEVYRQNVDELEKISDQEQRHNRLVELNVISQVRNLCKTTIVQSAWKKSSFPYIHGWVYDVHDGILKDLNVTFNNNRDLIDVFQLDGI